MSRTKQARRPSGRRSVEASYDRAQPVLECLAFAPLLLLLLWVLLRIGTFFFLPVLDDGLKQTVNVPVKLWLMVIGLHLVFLMFGLALQAAHFWRFRDPIFIGSFVILVAALLVLELLIPVMFHPAVSLAAWLNYANTWVSKAAYTRVVKATPVVVTYSIRSTRHQTTNALISNWRCALPAIQYKTFFDPKLAQSPLCLDVHTGLYGWPWIDKLRACSAADMASAVPVGQCDDGKP